MQNRTWTDRIGDSINYALLFIISLCAVLPFVYVLAGSFTASEELLGNRLVLFPTKYSLDGYRYIFSSSVIGQSLAVTVFITVAGTLTNLLFTCLMAFGLAHKDLAGRKVIMFLVVFTLLFSGGIIPTYLIVKSFGLINTFGALIIPGAISAFNLIILKNFFQQLPDGLEEAAEIDGCNYLQIMFRIVIPLSLPAIATFALFYAVGHWNQFFSALLYINDSNKWPIQIWLRQIVILASGGIGDSSQFGETFVPPAQTVKMATIVIATVPILMVYPFLQKHFAKGVLLGSVKE
ncbi:MAG: YtcP3 [Paenibacillaceae bacterium]|jgi:putative aldouronate transport system permease protein|nr:YtcP3 [Paenibacillaceae bacterium]